MNKKFLSVCGALWFAVATPNVYADNEEPKAGCPVGLVKGMDLNTEFGPGADHLTRCIQKRTKVKLLVQINQFCAGAPVNGSCAKAFALDNIKNAIDDYEITDGMKPGRDFEIAVVVHGQGGGLVVKDSVLVAHKKGTNPFEAQVRGLMKQGVKFYFCQNTTRHMIADGTLTKGKATEEIIEGVEFTTAGVTAIADFQSAGWTYIQP